MRLVLRILLTPIVFVLAPFLLVVYVALLFGAMMASLIGDDSYMRAMLEGLEE